MKWLFLIALLCLLAVPAAAHEQWHESTARHPDFKRNDLIFERCETPFFDDGMSCIRYVTPHNHAAALQEYLLLEQFCWTWPDDDTHEKAGEPHNPKRMAFLESLGLECP